MNEEILNIMEEIEKTVSLNDILGIDDFIFQKIIKTIERKYKVKIKNKADLRINLSKIAFYENIEYINLAHIIGAVYLNNETLNTIGKNAFYNLIYDFAFASRREVSYKKYITLIKEIIVCNKKISERKCNILVGKLTYFIQYLSWERNNKSIFANIVSSKNFRTKLFKEETNSFLKKSISKLRNSEAKTIRILVNLKNRLQNYYNENYRFR